MLFVNGSQRWNLQAVRMGTQVQRREAQDGLRVVYRGRLRDWCFH